MRLQTPQLSQALQKNLAPIYLLSGDEPLQLAEAADKIRLAAKQRDYLNRTVLVVEGNFNWQQIILETSSTSIFADKHLVEVKIPAGKFGLAGSKVIQAYCQRPPADCVLLLISGKLASSTLKSKWYQAVDKLGVTMQVWHLNGTELLQWLQQRLLQRGLQLEMSAVKLIAARVEGNLLAAVQEIEKLYVIYGSGRISNTDIEAAVTDNSRFDVFALTDAVLQGKLNRSLKILYALETEGIAAPVVLWALSREIRQLITLKLASNLNLEFKKLGIWMQRQQGCKLALARLNLATLKQGLQLSAQADREIKGQQSGNYWETLYLICVLMNTNKVILG